ncbi:MAG: DUF3164 family protein [Bacteroidales bacterium]
MKLENLSKEEREQLKREILLQEKAEGQRKLQEREDYKSLVENFVSSNLIKLQKLSAEMMRVKEEVIEEAATLIKLKDELYLTKSDRRSDTFTAKNGSSITLGSRTNEGWDDTVNNGIEKVQEYLNSLAKDEDTAILVDTVMGLLAKDRKGSLKASKVLELEKMAVRSGDKDFIEGIQIIKEAYQPKPSCRFIDVRLMDHEGNSVALPLTLSAIR